MAPSSPRVTVFSSTVCGPESMYGRWRKGMLGVPKPAAFWSTLFTASPLERGFLKFFKVGVFFLERLRKQIPSCWWRETRK